MPRRRYRDGESETEGTEVTEKTGRALTRRRGGTGNGEDVFGGEAAAAGLRRATLAMKVREDPSPTRFLTGLDPPSPSSPAARSAAQRPATKRPLFASVSPRLRVKRLCRYLRLLRFLRL